jgi:hypothetical protein
MLLAVCTTVGLGSWLGPVVSGERDGDLRLAGVTSVVVEPGDSLWSIAEAVSDGEDVRTVIDRIQELNGLEGSVLVPGQVLQLP